MKVVNKVRTIRQEKKISQVNLAKQSGLSEPTIRNIEQNIYTGRLSTLQRIADALGVKVKDLFEEVSSLNEDQIKVYESFRLINEISE